MDRAADLAADYERLGELLAGASGSGAAALVRERRLIGIGTADDVRSDYDRLGRLLERLTGADEDDDASGAAAIARERRLLAVELERLEAPGEVSRVDELAAKRAAAGVVRPAARRRKSG